MATPHEYAQPEEVPIKRPVGKLTNKMQGVGQFAFAVGLSGLGVLSLIFDDFALVWQPVPSWVPQRELLAYASGFILVVGGLGTLFKRTAGWATSILAGFVLTWLLFLQIPRVFSAPLSEGMWLGFCENLLLVAGGWVLFVSTAVKENRNWGQLASGDAGLRLGRYLFGLALPLIGLSHFVYTAGTASMVPAWIPGRVFIAYLSGSAHIAAGIGILLGLLPRLAAMLEASMITLFVLLLHMPGIVSRAARPTPMDHVLHCVLVCGRGVGCCGLYARARAFEEAS